MRNPAVSLRAPFKALLLTSTAAPISASSSAAFASRSLSTLSRPRATSTPMSERRRLAQVSSHLSMSASPSHSFTTSAAALAAGQVSRTGGGETGDEPKVKQLSEGSVRTILLNKPKTLNALDTDMVRLLDEALETFSASPAPVILLRGVGRALCSGGDVMAVVNFANDQNPAQRQRSLQFFKEEFELDYKIATLAERKGKTFVSVMDGITMGGGVGLSVHAPIRIATEKTRFAMPETGIGYFPDVGVTRQLARLDGRIGAYLGATGREIGGEEAYLAGLATHFITTASLPQALHRLTTLPTTATGAQVSAALDEFTADPFAETENPTGFAKAKTTPLLGDRRIALDYAFGQPSAEATFSALDEIAAGDAGSQAARELGQLGVSKIGPALQDWAKETLGFLHKKSPRSIKVSLWATAEARGFDVAEAFRFDMRLATAFCDLGAGRDFYEGVHHTLGRDPKTGKRRTGRANWSPASIAEVDDTKTRALFFGDESAARKAGLTMDVPRLRVLSSEQLTPAERQRRDRKLRGVGPGAWEPEHNPFALPSEAELTALIDGSHPSAGSVRLEGLDEVLSVLRNVKGERRGLQLKVEDWLDRQMRRGNAASA